MGRTERLSGYDYSSVGCYFVTFCTKNRQKILSDIVGRDDLGAPTRDLPRSAQLIPRIVFVLKRFTNRETGRNLWQSTYHDHIVRTEEDYLNIWSYIETNPIKWSEDRYYTLRMER